jgi:hypothetical protein
MVRNDVIADNSPIASKLPQVAAGTALRHESQGFGDRRTRQGERNGEPKNGHDGKSKKANVRTHTMPLRCA